ncbi:hypothetical protein HWD03_gp117 [Alteromonas phage vB_AmeM_PT11-V22]|uniref:Uncharacterized protein n=1 Tax=Alteromonas phage vB_AmeM_PT11-V22 TaxID=2704031 RepID=A0A6C0R0X6_9CAUD|nr:hypothetical protein HWD03_gp117 [Alteromonas phage vB_AmeM_PT11-V22]QHZ59848.1 hypothetical protein [Alteromonas phage vB_AmeM_PT11-V22]
MSLYMFCRVGEAKVINLIQVTNVYVNEYGNVFCHLATKKDAIRVDKYYADNFLSHVDEGLRDYRNKRVKQQEEYEMERRKRGY